MFKEHLQVMEVLQQQVKQLHTSVSPSPSATPTETALENSPSSLSQQPPSSSRKHLKVSQMCVGVVSLHNK